jgi:hypothetical protein
MRGAFRSDPLDGVVKIIVSGFALLCPTYLAVLRLIGMNRFGALWSSNNDQPSEGVTVVLLQCKCFPLQ